MGKKGSWFSAIKRAFTPNTTKEKPLNEVQGLEKRGGKKKWGLGKLRHHGGEDASAFSSIERILSDVDAIAQRDWQIERQPEKTPPPPISSSDKTPSMPLPLPSRRFVPDYHQNQGTTPNNHAAIRIQAAYRAYVARRSFRALKGLVRLQGVVRGQSVKRQTANAMKHMQLLVKVQSQIHSRRIHMLENQARQNPHNKNDSDTTLGGRFRWTLSQTSETDRQEEEWDDSVLTKEEIDARMQRKVEALVKRERAQAYADSLQWLKARSAQAALMDIRSGGVFPWWWSWIERQLPDRFPESQPTPSKHNLTPSPRLMLEEPSPRQTPQSSKYKQQRFGVENLESLTPKSSKSASVAVTSMTRKKYAPILLNNGAPIQPTNSSASTPVKHLRPRRTSNGGDFSFDVHMRDDDSLTSCPPFSVPNYMTPTVSAKAKVRSQINAYEERLATPDEKKKRRMSFPLTPSIGSSIKWNKAYSLFSSKDSSSQLGKHKSFQSMSNFSMDSATSMPATIGRKPFNRFV